MMKSRWRKCGIRTLLGAVAGLVAGLVLGIGGLGQPWEEWSRDLRLRNRPVHNPSSLVRIVGVNDGDLKVFGTWPFPRGVHADIVRILHAAGVRQMGLDFMFTEPSADSSMDAVLKRTLEEVPEAVLAYNFEGIGTDQAEAQPIKNHFATGYRYGVEVGRSGFPVAYDPVPPFIPIEITFGAANAPTAEADGVIRSVPLFFQHQGKLYPGLAMQTLMRGLSVEVDQVNVRPGRWVELVNTPVGTLKIPIDKNGAYRVNFGCRLEGFTPAFSYSNLYGAVSDESLARQISPELKGKFVMVGTVATATADIVTTPLGRLPGVVVQATILSNILEGTHLKMLPLWAVVLLATCIGAVTSLLLGCGRIWWQLAIFVGIVSLIGAIWTFAASLDWLLPTVPTAGAVTMAAAAVLCLQMVSARREKTRLAEAFRPYVARTLFKRLGDEDGVASRKSERRELTVFFSDIRGFTRWIEQRDPEEITSVLNEYFGVMLPIVDKYGGTLDKLIGDAIMVFFGAPEPMEQHAEAGIRMAWEMQTEMESMQARWAKEDRPRLSVGMAIHTGFVTVGNFGCETFMDYTVVGSSVNLASRIESFAPGNTLLVTARTLALAGEAVSARPFAELCIKGMEEPVLVHEVVGVSGFPDRSMMPAEWMIEIDGRVLGPFPFSGVEAMRAAGRVESEAKVTRIESFAEEVETT